MGARARLDHPDATVVIPLHTPSEALGPTAIALGSFDGLHAGHRRVIAAVSPSPAPLVPTVVSFWPHPREVLHGETRLRLDLPEEKLELLEPLGIRQLVLVPFTLDLASLSPEAFVQEVLGQQLAARRVAVGENFRFGTKRSGDCHDLVRLGERHGIAVEVVPMLWDQSKRISSSRIRQALSMADLSEARRLLNRPYRFRGRVVMGRGLGRQLGWPTANLQVDGRKFLPLEGVYAALAWRVGVAEGPMAAVMNLGPQPTVDPTAPSAVEVHLLDRQLDLLEASLVVEPISLLRRQERFADLAALTSQIARDAQQARQIFAAASAGRIGVGESPTDEQGDGSEQQDA